MKIMTLNVNGIRSAMRRGFYDWLHTQDIDIVCLQETKIQESQLPSMSLFFPAGYECVYAHAEKKGYSGVAIYSKLKPKHVFKTLGFTSCDQEGRFLQFDFDHFSVASIYFPSGTSGEHRQIIKMDFLSQIEAHLHAILTSNRHFILCGDYNIAHKQIDLKNWRANQTRTGFLPEERAWMDKLFNEFGFIDAFRVVRPTDATYTWWSYRANAWAKDVGWRIDYQVVTPGLSGRIKSAEVYREPRFSDHAPLVIDYNL